VWQIMWPTWAAVFAALCALLAAGKGRSVFWWAIVGGVFLLAALLALLAQPQRRHTRPGRAQAGAVLDVAEQLRRLSEQHAQGVISDTEYALARRELLGPSTPRGTVRDDWP